LSRINPKLSIEWDYSRNMGITPNGVRPYSSKKVWWNCEKGHSYSATVANRSLGGSCPYCSGRKAYVDNCLKTLDPALSSEWNYERNEKSPAEYTLHSGQRVWWRCHKGHEWYVKISDRGETGCPYCSKIELKDGAICDSLTEAYYCLKLKESGAKFKQHVGIGLGRYSCDFHILDSNEYIETTGYDKSWRWWRAYLKKIAIKKKHIENVLNAKFIFIQMRITPQQIQYVRKNSR
jgi:hypothetical protein